MPEIQDSLNSPEQELKLFDKGKELLKYVQRSFQEDVKHILEVNGSDDISEELYGRFLDVKRDYSKAIFEKAAREQSGKNNETDKH